MPDKNLISIGEIATNHGRRRQSVHNIVKRFGIDTVKVASANARGQKVSCITMEDYRVLEQHLADSTQKTGDNAAFRGVFYLAQIEPILDPGRFKVGFATDINERTRSHKTIAPFLEIVKTWPCKLLWEKTAIECVTHNCEQIYTEVFRTDDIRKVIERADEFFDIMPQLIGWGRKTNDKNRGKQSS